MIQRQDRARMLSHEGIIILLAVLGSFSDGIPGTTLKESGHNGHWVGEMVDVLEIPNNHTLVVSSSDLQHTVVVTTIWRPHERDLDSEDFLQSRYDNI